MTRPRGMPPAMDQAAELGSPYIVASPPRGGRRSGPRHRAVRRVDGHRRVIGVMPSMEFLGFVDGVKNVASAWAIAIGDRRPPGDGRGRRLPHDPRRRHGRRPAHLPGDRLANFHINDVPAQPDPLTQTDEDRVMVGDGIADLPRVIANLRSIGYRGPLSLELFNRDLWECDPATVVKRGLERVRSLVES